MNSKTLLAKYGAGEIVFDRVSLGNANLFGSDLIGISLNEADLHGATVAFC